VRIGFNATLLSGHEGYRRSGIARYLDRLLHVLPAALAADELIVYTGRGVPPVPSSSTSTWRSAFVPLHRAPLRIAWEHVVLPVATRRDRIDLFHGTMNVVPRLLACPAVVTIHDLAFLRWPEQVPKRRYRYLAAGVRHAVNQSRQVVAVSAATKADVVELLQVDPSRISITPLGVDPTFRPVDEHMLATFRERHTLKRPFILAVGNLEPRKNLPALLRAFAQIANDIPHDLVLVGGEGWLTGEIHDTLTALRLGDRVHMTGFVADDDLPIWYSAADLFVLPSLYEGFGLPILEAMACGTPVIASNTSSMPEVAGNAALLIDPQDDDAIATGIARVLNDPAFANDLRRRGLTRATRFTWEATAAQTVAVYRQAAGGMS
jgi:glycosyltransferase involved in cell wall biosynthesis